MFARACSTLKEEKDGGRAHFTMTPDSGTQQIVINSLRAVIFQTVIFHAVIFQSIIFQVVIFQAVIFQSVIFQAVIFLLL